MPRYNPSVLEPKWQKFWEENEVFKTPDMPAGEKLYVLDMFPYPSGDGLHVGHPEGYTATDIVCRFERMRGKSVLHPMGFDAFGLPAEEHAIRTNTPPRESTERNIATFRRQLKSLGFSYDWDRELATTEVDYFRWTQWIFLVLFDTWFDDQQQQGRPINELPIPDDVKSEGDEAVRLYQDEHRLAYQSDALVNWCPALGTVLANEEVKDGRSERGGHPVERLPLRQWMLRITAYAERLIDDLESVNWPEGIKTMQRDWIGRSTGAEVDFFIGSNPAGGFDIVETGMAARYEDETAHDRFAEFEEWKNERAKRGFSRNPGDDVLRVYTTRPDTLFGATYMVIAPEHPLAAELTTSAHAEEVGRYCEQATRKSDRERTEDKQKTGVITGSYAINPVNAQPIPIWIADYVLISYGTGAIMAVPAHDERDFEFAESFQIPIVAVVDPGDVEGVDREAVLAGEQCFAGDGSAVNSSKYDGLATADFKQKITEDLSGSGVGRQAVNYKLRDWLFSRQRFWGEPFPILHKLDGDGEPTDFVRAVDPTDLPVDLPHLDDYKPHGQAKPPLEKSPDDWLYVEIDGHRYKRETNTMPQWAGSCWYYLRFIDPKNDQAFVDAEKEKAWMPVDLYVGGAEHAVLHLLYARFWHKVLYDRGYVSTAEPFRRLVNQGMILGEPQFYVSPEAFEEHKATLDKMGIAGIRVEGDGKVMYLLRNQKDESVPATDIREDQTEKRKGQVYLTGTVIPLVARADKMSKSRGNVVNPDEIVHEYGADALRLYEMFMGPLEASPKPWSMAGVNGVRNFLDRVWRMIVDERSAELALNAAVQEAEPTEEQTRVLHKTIKVVTHDLERMEFNTAIARMMEFVNAFTKAPARPKSAMQQFVLLLSPFAPHICEELWQLLGGRETLAYQSWPAFDEALTVDESIEIPVSINGKVRAKMMVAADISKEDLEAAALADGKIAESIEGKEVKKVIVVPGRMVNIVAK